MKVVDTENHVFQDRYDKNSYDNFINHIPDIIKNISKSSNSKTAGRKKKKKIKQKTKKVIYIYYKLYMDNCCNHRKLLKNVNEILIIKYFLYQDALLKKDVNKVLMDLLCVFLCSV